MKFCFTIDLDRDVNIRVDGQKEAGSIDVGQGISPRFSSSEKGLVRYSELLDAIGIKCTFFAEGRTLINLRNQAGCLSSHEVGAHGMEHEDFSLCSPEEAYDVVDRVKNVVKDISGTYPVSFRAPYMRKPEYLNEILRDHGFTADSSEYAGIHDCHPRAISGGLSEVPVLSCPAPSGGLMTAYLWPMHEGRRGPESYLRMVDQMDEDSTIVLCDHSWHIVETRNGGLRDSDSCMGAENGIRSIIEALLDRGVKPCTIHQALF